MLKVQRLATVWSATIFFLIISPILAIYALGYDFDLKKNDLKNTITTSLETAPDGAKIESLGDFGRQINYSNSDFRLPTNNQFKVDITKENFKSEEFLLKGKTAENSLVRLKKIHLLPTDEQTNFKIDPAWSDISFVSKDLLLFSKTDESQGQKKWFLQLYTYGGFLGQPKLISSFVSKTDLTIDQSLPINLDMSLEPTMAQIPTNSFWEELDTDIFWQKETQTYLFKDSLGVWKIWQSGFLSLGELDTIWLGQNMILLHDRVKSKNLYLYNINLDVLTYLTDNIQAVSFNNNELWVWTQDWLYRFAKDDIKTLQNLNWDRFKKYKISEFEGYSSSSPYPEGVGFKVKNVYQGIITYINGQIFYLADGQTDKWKLVAENVKFWTSAWNSVFWISGDNLLMTQNLELGYRRFIAPLNFNTDNIKVINMDYYANWHRVFFYVSDTKNPNPNMQVYSIWYNPDFVNNEIRTFSQQKWLDEKVCRSFIEGGYIFCINNDNDLITLRNTN